MVVFTRQRWYRTLLLWAGLVGRNTPAGLGRLSPRLAWKVARIVTRPGDD
jgi:hypothetical protein